MPNSKNYWQTINQSDLPAIISFQDEKRCELSFRELHAIVDLQIESFRTRGLEPGQTAVLTVSNPRMDVICFLALSSLGVGTYCPQGQSGVERRVISFLGIETTISDSSVSVSTKRVIKPEIALTKDAPMSLAKTSSQDLSLPWLIRSSSGTTGAPKIFTTTRAESLSRRARYCDAVGIGRGDCFYSFTPTRFGAARQRAFYALTKGASVLVLDENVSLASKIDYISCSGVTNIYCVPMYLEYLCDYAEKNLAKGLSVLFPKLKCIETTSSLVSPKLRKRVVKLLTPNFVIAYSVSEVGHITSTRRSLKADYDLNDIGVPLNGIDLDIYDHSKKQLVRGESGLIGVRVKGGKPVTYLDLESVKNLPMEDLFFTGDVGFISKNGNLIFQGRSDDMMIFNGINIFPYEIESALEEFPEVVDVVAFPLPSQIHYQIPCAALILKNSESGSDIFKRCKQVLGARSPRLIIRVDSFPRNPMGKVLRRELQEIALKELKSQRLN